MKNIVREMFPALRANREIISFSVRDDAFFISLRVICSYLPLWVICN